MNTSFVFRSFLCVTFLAGLFCSAARAVPYASGVSESGGTVSWILNEDADSVTVKRTGDTDLVLGALTKGAQSFPLGAASAYEIEVTNSSASGWAQTSNDSDIGSQYFSPRSVAINKNPTSPNFGNIYVSEGIGGLTATGDRDTLEGIFGMKADQTDTVVSGGQGDDGFVGGHATEWESTGNTPYRLFVAPDDTLYISGWGDSSSGVWRAPADLDESSTWPNLLADDNPAGGGLFDNHGSISAVWVEDTGASTKLYTIDEDYGDRGDINRYDIGTATNYAALPVDQVSDDTNHILNGLMSFVRDEDGSWWIAQFRFTDTSAVPALSHWADGGVAPLWTSGRTTGLADADFDEDTQVAGVDFLRWQAGFGTDAGTAEALTADGNANFDTLVDEADFAIWEAQFGTTQDTLNLDRGGRSLDIHNGSDLLLAVTLSGNGVDVIDISDPNNPVLSAVIPQSGTANGAAFDIAGNAYVVSRSSETLRIWSPGGDTIASTKSDGTFTLSEPGPAVSAGAAPEPSSLMLGLLGLAGMTWGSTRSRRSSRLREYHR